MTIRLRRNSKAKLSSNFVKFSQTVAKENDQKCTNYVTLLSHWYWPLTTNFRKHLMIPNSAVWCFGPLINDENWEYNSIANILKYQYMLNYSFFRNQFCIKYKEFAMQANKCKRILSFCRFLLIRPQKNASYIGMALLSSFVYTWLICVITWVEVAWLIFIKFHDKISNHKRKVGMDFQGYGPNRFRITDQRVALNKHFMEFYYITPIKA